MGTLRQYYGNPGVPLVVDADPHDVVVAWRSQRTRLRAWLDELPDDAWTGPTRCDGWDVTLLVRHLSSATQFLGYTLTEASEHTATTLLEGMDTRTTPAAAAELLGDRSPTEARALLADTDAVVEAALARLGDRGLLATAEAPPGHLAAHLALSHFLFDSWVHEYDLLLPRGEHPEVDPLESRVVMAYLIGLSIVAVDDPAGTVPLELRTSDPDLRIGVEVAGGTVTVTPGRAPGGAVVVEGRVVDVVDRLTGRAGGPVGGHRDGVAALDRFALVLSA